MPCCVSKKRQVYPAPVLALPLCLLCPPGFRLVTQPALKSAQPDPAPSPKTDKLPLLWSPISSVSPGRPPTLETTTSGALARHQGRFRFVARGHCRTGLRSSIKCMKNRRAFSQKAEAGRYGGLPPTETAKGEAGVLAPDLGGRRDSPGGSNMKPWPWPCLRTLASKPPSYCPSCRIFLLGSPGVLQF